MHILHFSFPGNIFPGKEKYCLKLSSKPGKYFLEKNKIACMPKFAFADGINQHKSFSHT